MVSNMNDKSSNKLKLTVRKGPSVLLDAVVHPLLAVFLLEGTI